jgi:hypothetical protein
VASAPQGNCAANVSDWLGTVGRCVSSHGYPCEVDWSPTLGRPHSRYMRNEGTGAPSGTGTELRPCRHIIHHGSSG